MRDRTPLISLSRLAVFILSVLRLCCAGQIFGQEQADLRQMINRAKSDVFPALIFVKPIVEDYGSGEKKQQEVFGSGVVVSSDGYAVTNWHVVDKAVTINCVLHDKRQVEVELIGSDRDTDLALLKLPDPAPGQTYPCAGFADSSHVQEGDFVMALGSPFGFQRSISLGIVSNAQRYIGFESEHKYNTWIQTDAAINPGNSGGPLIDTEGRIVGVNTLGVSGSGLGFSIPASMVQTVMTQLKQDGQVVRAYTGLRLQALKDFHSNTFVDVALGVLITGVEENSPAAEAGIRAGDILQRIDGQVVEGTYAEMLPAIWCRLADLRIGTPVSLELQRGSETFQATITPEEKGQLEGDDLDCRRWNMTVKEINKYRTPRLYYLQKKGVYIQGVKRPGNAVSSGLNRRDIIVKIDGMPVETIDQVGKIYERIIADEQREKKVMFEVLRSGLRKWIVLDYRRDYDEE
ncbi:MAG: trypsin-like peptidase domain-containing protein [Phycisphaerales bacterium]|nr:MAG: trypsin-like peptidase domain-containing protein [Phycisphaerales bacterium]